MASLNRDKFKVGDKVVFIENHPRDPFYPKYGATGTVVRTDGDGCPMIKWDKPAGPGWEKYCICDFRLEKFVEPKKVLIWQDPHDMLRVVARDLATNETGEARCHPNEQDKFDFSVGALIALGRLYGHEPEITVEKIEAPKPAEPMLIVTPNLEEIRRIRHLCKFKVGDKVIGNENAKRYGITKQGWVGTVTEIIDPHLGGGCDEDHWINFKVNGHGLGGCSLPVADDAFDLYEEPESETVAHCNLEENARIIAMILDFDAQGKVFDWYEQHIQQILPRLEVSPDEPKYYNGKVILIKNDPDFDFWTEGRVYEIKDGVICDDSGIPRDRITSLDELPKVTYPTLKFVEYKGEEPRVPAPREPVYYTSKVVCIHSDYPYWTVGKVYKVRNGRIVDDEGGGRTGFHSLKNLNDYMRITSSRYVKFIELKE